MKPFILAALALAGFATTAHADCLANGHGKPGTRSEWVVSGVRPGVPCTISLYTSGPRVAFRSLELVRAPRFGSVRFEGASIVYTPSAKFKGKDSFFVKHHVEGSDGSGRKPSRMHFAVSG